MYLKKFLTQWRKKIRFKVLAPLSPWNSIWLLLISNVGFYWICTAYLLMEIPIITFNYTIVYIKGIKQNISYRHRKDYFLQDLFVLEWNLSTCLMIKIIFTSLQYLYLYCKYIIMYNIRVDTSCVVLHSFCNSVLSRSSAIQVGLTIFWLLNEMYYYYNNV